MTKTGADVSDVTVDLSSSLFYLLPRSRTVGGWDTRDMVWISWYFCIFDYFDFYSDHFPKHSIQSVIYFQPAQILFIGIIAKKMVNLPFKYPQMGNINTLARLPKVNIDESSNLCVVLSSDCGCTWKQWKQTYLGWSWSAVTPPNSEISKCKCGSFPSVRTLLLKQVMTAFRKKNPKY